MADLSSIARELRAAKAYRLAVLAACEQFVEERAAEGDAEALELAKAIVDSRGRNARAVFAAQLAALPAAPDRL